MVAETSVFGEGSRNAKIIFIQYGHLVKDHVAEEITKLKQQPGKDLALFGSTNLMATLMQMDLIDEHRIMVNSVILGNGTPLFKKSKDKLALKLVRTRTFRNGNILLCYEPDQK